MRSGRMIAVTGAMLALAAFGSVPAVHSSQVVLGRNVIVADAQAMAFTLRPTYDAGGAAPLNFYIGYADANLATPPSAADGQASWYNFGIAETAAFKPPDECIPRNEPDADNDGVPDAVEDAQTYVGDYLSQALARAQSGEPPPPPLIPGARGLCAERLSGFAQSRFPDTVTIDGSASDNYFDKPAAASACRDDLNSAQCGWYKAYWPQFASTARKAARDGSFTARATPDSQESEALLMGAGDGTIVSVGLARNVTRAAIVDGKAVVESSARLDDVCIGVTGETCALRVDHIEQVARVVAGPEPTKTAYTTIAGVRGVAGDHVIKASDLKLEQGSIDLGGYFQIQAVTKTNSCEGEPGDLVADAGGFRIFGKGGSGGGIMVGGACARARLSSFIEFIDTSKPDTTDAIPGRTLTLPGTPAVPGGPQVGTPALGAPRIVTRTVTHPEYLRPIAWRTAPWWGSILGALLLLGVLLYVFRAQPAAAPVVHALDRFARQFLKG